MKNVDIPDWEEWLPRSGFLNRYLEWTKNHEAPCRFHFWTALTILSAVVGRRYYVSKGFYRIYPNLYTLLVAPSGRCRKTRGSAIGVSLLDHLDVRVLANKFTPEDMIARLEEVKVGIQDGAIRVQRTCEGFVYASELTVLMGQTQYNSSLVDLLTDFADAPNRWAYSTKKDGEQILENVAVTLLGCSTPEWLGTAIPQRAFGGGFLARIFFIVREQTPRFFAVPEEQDESIRAELVTFLKRVREGTGQCSFTPAGLKWYEAWYERNRDIGGDLRLNGYFERKPDHMLRIAILLALAEERELILDEGILCQAVEVLEAVEPDMHKALVEINVSQSGRDINRVLDLLVRRPQGVNYEGLVDAMIPYMSTKSLDEALRALIASRRTQELITPSGRSYLLTGQSLPPSLLADLDTVPHGIGNATPVGLGQAGEGNGLGSSHFLHLEDPEL